MGILDRMVNKGRETVTETGEFSTPDLADKAPVFKRLDTLIEYVSKAVPAGNKVGPIIRRIAVDMTDDIQAFPPEVVELYIKYFASMLFWVAEGNTPDEFPLPEDFKAIDPS
jgi:hypothetical protein